jgi:hypothetical protein
MSCCNIHYMLRLYCGWNAFQLAFTDLPGVSAEENKQTDDDMYEVHRA